MPLRVPSCKRAISVFLVEQHEIARNHLKLILCKERQFRVTEIDAHKLKLKASRRATLDIFVLSHVSGSIVQKYVKLIHQAGKNRKILVISQPSRVSATISLLRSGVHGFLSDEDVDRDLPSAVRTLTEGRIWVRSNWLIPGTLNHDSAESTVLSGSGAFTPQQLRVIELVRESLSNKQIAAELGISERTVKFHLRNIFMSLGIDNRQAIRDLPLPTDCPTRQSDHNLQLPYPTRQ